MSDDDGPLVTQAYVCPAPGAKLELQDTTLPAMKATFVEIDMKLCGLCHTDIKMRSTSSGRVRVSRFIRMVYIDTH